MDKINVELLDKHRNYINKYKPNDLYWGIGIENETYLKMNKNIKIDPNTYYEKFAKRERYSIDYFNSSYKNIYTDYIKNQTLPIRLPILLNAHTFLKTDTNNEHITTYSKNPEPNIKFNGKTIYEFLCENDSYFKDEYMKSFIFDGDTIEFITTNFYKVTIFDVINELKNNKNIFITKLNKIFIDNNIFSDFGEVKICNKNFPFVSFMSNLGNYSIFNNMTYHFNFTLPTQLNSNCFINDYSLFKKQHKNAIHAIQWIEPILIANFGSGDIFYESDKKLSNCSQRCAKSRFISIGTYDTEKLEPGKILQIDVSDNHLSNYNNWWFNKYYEKSNYKKEKKIGVDINFHKHKNHGIEIRIFDYFDEDKLEKVLTFIVLLLDFSLEYDIQSPSKNNNWNELVTNILFDKNYKFKNSIKNEIKNIFNLTEDFNNAMDLFDKLYNYLFNKYDNKGICYTKMVKPPIVKNNEELINPNKIILEDNKLTHSNTLITLETESISLPTEKKSNCCIIM
jgi:hypothetical protein